MRQFPLCHHQTHLILRRFAQQSLEGRNTVDARDVMRCFSALGSIAVAGLIAIPAQAQLLTHKDLSLTIATTIAQTALDKCTAEGYGVSVVVVDRAGETIVALRGDKASPHTMENARRKAYTAMTFRLSTSDYAKRYADNNPVVHQQVTLPNVIAIPGGLPVKAGDEVIGGAGLSGTPGVDEPCVQAGLDKVADQLK
jgi:uncharacterized protein GlcG (DUF336 family)